MMTEMSRIFELVKAFGELSEQWRLPALCMCIDEISSKSEETAEEIAEMITAAVKDVNQMLGAYPGTV